MKTITTMLSELEVLVRINALSRKAAKELIEVNGVTLNPYMEKEVSKEADQIMKGNGLVLPSFLRKIGLKKS